MGVYSPARDAVSVRNRRESSIKEPARRRPWKHGWGLAGDVGRFWCRSFAFALEIFSITPRYRHRPSRPMTPRSGSSFFAILGLETAPAARTSESSKLRGAWIRSNAQLQLPATRHLEICRRRFSGALQRETPMPFGPRGEGARDDAGVCNIVACAAPHRDCH